MKELENKKIDKTELHAVKPIKKEVRKVGTLRLHPGQKVWQLDLKTLVISEAEYEKGAADFEQAAKGAPGIIRHKIIVLQNHLYCTAINASNADKKFFKMLGVKRPPKAIRNNK